MPNPVKPSDLKSCIPATSGSLCDKLVKVLTVFPQLVYNFYSYIYNEDGTFTDEFKADLCGMDCSGAENPNLVAPTSVAASNGTLAGKINITWVKPTTTAGTGIAGYRVYRSSASDPSAASIVQIAQLAGQNTLTLDDADPSLIVGVQYRYWVKTVQGDGQSGPYSIGAVGTAA